MKNKQILFVYSLIQMSIAWFAFIEQKHLVLYYSLPYDMRHIIFSHLIKEIKSTIDELKNFLSFILFKYYHFNESRGISIEEYKFIQHLLYKDYKKHLILSFNHRNANSPSLRLHEASLMVDLEKRVKEEIYYCSL
jgi:hypothetical protein